MRYQPSTAGSFAVVPVELSFPLTNRPSICKPEEVPNSGQQLVGSRLNRHIDQKLACLDAVDTESPSFDDLLIAQLTQGNHCTAVSDLKRREPIVPVEVAGHVVNPDKVQVAHANTLEAILERSKKLVPVAALSKNSLLSAL